MSRVSLPHDATAEPTKPEVRAVLLARLDLAPSDHFVEVGSCTGAVTVLRWHHGRRQSPGAHHLLFPANKR